MDRRTLLRGLGVGAAGIAATGGVGGLLAACGTQRSPLVAESVPASGPWWMRGNFAPVHEEVDAVDLEVAGSLPPELSGLFVRNGSNPAVGESPHWFLGDGMLHGVRLEQGRAAWYRNRWVRTPAFEAGEDFLGGGPPGGANNQSNVSLVHHGGKLLSLGEVGFPYDIDPATLESLGAWDFDGRLTTAMTAHPKIDPATGQMHFFGYGFVAPFLTYHVAEADGTLVRSEEIEVGASTMMHDFAITDREAIFWELPVLFDLEAAVGGSTLPFTWDPGYGARIGVLGFDEPASSIRWVEIDPCYAFHGVNAHREGDDIVLDICRQESMFAQGETFESSALHRWRIGTGGASLTWSDERLDDAERDLPTIDRRHTGRPTRHAWFAEVGRDGLDGSPDEVSFVGVGHRDATTGAVESWRSDEVGVGEAYFVPGGPGEAEGWLLAFAHDRPSGRSQLVVLDALDVAAGPVATVHLPVRVPYGFHATWVPDTA